VLRRQNEERGSCQWHGTTIFFQGIQQACPKSRRIPNVPVSISMHMIPSPQPIFTNSPDLQPGKHLTLHLPSEPVNPRSTDLPAQSRFYLHTFERIPRHHARFQAARYCSLLASTMHTSILHDVLCRRSGFRHTRRAIRTRKSIIANLIIFPAAFAPSLCP